MTDIDQKELGNTLWNIADQLRGAMNADDFRDYDNVNHFSHICGAPHPE